MSRFSIMMFTPPGNLLRAQVKQQEIHPDPKLARHQDQSVLTISKAILDAEEKILESLGLPGIKAIEKRQVPDEPLKINLGEKLVFVDTVVSEMVLKIAGRYQGVPVKRQSVDETDDTIDDDEKKIKESLFGKLMETAFKLFILFYFSKLWGAAPGFLRDRLIKLFPNVNLEAFKEVFSSGLLRIKDLAYQNNYIKVRALFLKAMNSKMSQAEFAAQLHSLFGGSLWQWSRLIRSEITLIGNAVFNMTGAANGARFEKWFISIGACDICAALAGNIWRFGEGPRPVESTHPNCNCWLEYIFETPKEFRDKWNEPSPYGG